MYKQTKRWELFYDQLVRDSWRERIIWCTASKYILNLNLLNFLFFYVIFSEKVPLNWNKSAKCWGKIYGIFLYTVNNTHIWKGLYHALSNKIAHIVQNSYLRFMWYKEQEMRRSEWTWGGGEVGCHDTNVFESWLWWKDVKSPGWNLPNLQK